MYTYSISFQQVNENVEKKNHLTSDKQIGKYLYMTTLAKWLVEKIFYFCFEIEKIIHGIF